MPRSQRLSHLKSQRQGRRDVERLAADTLAECLPVEQLHHKERMAGRFAHVVHGADIGMIERRSGAGLALETFSRSIRREGCWQNFDGYLAMEPRVPGFIHLAHA